jgi:hypothetical protein
VSVTIVTGVVGTVIVEMVETVDQREMVETIDQREMVETIDQRFTRLM